ncbi:unnamed protein product [Darwinula stevensoni]|uniref:DNA mismatch repair proteins mutS family domain-containing protein n=1 Tax=Darwinula stevensoni TaxID=69355 RepID=A0A7R8XFU0_9CRUS|nr:unnamed protein product [Darwinula stevensoni]CAG0895860.1 unnamed protein product [Darwinula stevensoni]
MGICWAMSEVLITKRAFTILATHFLPLTGLQDLYFNVANYTFEAMEVSAESESSQATPSDDQMPEGRLRYTHKLKKGVTEIKNYGIRMAMLSSLPSSVIHRAMQLAEEIDQRVSFQPPATTNEGIHQNYDRRCYQLVHRLEQLVSHEQLSSAELLQHCTRLKEQFLTVTESSAEES